MTSDVTRWWWCRYCGGNPRRIATGSRAGFPASSGGSRTRDDSGRRNALIDAWNVQGLFFKGLTTLAIFGFGFSIGLAGVRALQARLDGMLSRYSGTLGEAADRSRVLDDVGFLGAVAGRLAFSSRLHLTGTVLVVGTLALLVMGILSGYVIASLALIGVLFSVPFVVSKLIDQALRRRTRMIEEALPDATTLIGSAMSAGLTLQAALASVALHMKRPLAT